MDGLRPGTRGERGRRAGVGAVVGRGLRRAALGAALLALAGCGSGSDGPGAGSSAPASARPAGPGGIGAVEALLTSGPAGSKGGRTPSALVPTDGLPSAGATLDADAAGLNGFQTPTKNIGCRITKEYVRCDIKERSWNPPPRPSSCPADHGDWGQGLTLESGRPAFVCAGDTVLNDRARVLPYGQAIRSGPFTCVSTTAFLACGNTASRHGFALAKGVFPHQY